MSIPSRMKNKMTDAINMVFAGIGYKNSTAMPSSGNNIDPILYEMHVSNHLASLAAKRKEKALSAAVDAGILADTRKKPYAAGTDEIIAAGEHLVLRVKVDRVKDKVNYEGVLDDLIEAGVSGDVVREMIAKNSSPGTNRHTFSAIIVTED